MIIGDLGNLEYPWKGKIDQVAIYARALSETEIRELYREGGWTGE